MTTALFQSEDFRSSLYPSDTATHFDNNSLSEAIETIIRQIWNNYELTGLVLYVADYERKTLKVRSGSGHKCSDEALFETELDFDNTKCPSFAALVFSEGLPQESNDSLKDPRFDHAALQKLGVHGAALGVPLRDGHRRYGSLIAWAEPKKLTEPTKIQISAQCDLIISALIKANRDRRQFSVLGKLSDLLLHCETEIDLRSVSSKCVDIALTANFDRVRLFSAIEGDKRFELIACADALGHYEYSIGSVLDFGKTESPYFNFLLDTLNRNKELENNFETQSTKAFLFRNANFGPDPYALSFDRPAELPWLVVPFYMSGNLLGYMVCENGSTNRSISSESIAYILLLVEIVVSSLEDRRKIYYEFLKRISSYTLPIYVPLMENSPSYNGIDIFFDTEVGGPLIFSAPEYQRTSISIGAKSSKQQVIGAKKVSETEGIQKISNVARNALMSTRTTLGSLGDDEDAEEFSVVVSEEIERFKARVGSQLDSSDPATHTPYSFGLRVLSHLKSSILDKTPASGLDLQGLFDEAVDYANKTSISPLKIY